MKIKKFEVGPLLVNCYLVYDENTKEAVVIDPGDEPELILDFIREKGLQVKYIVCTHGHFDHIGAVKEIREETKGEIIIHKDDLEIYRNSPYVAKQFFGLQVEAQPEPDKIIEDEESISIGNTKMSFIHTPGHSPGSLSLYFEGHLFTGDTLFAGSVGRTDLTGGNMKKLLNSLKKIASLPKDTIVLPGHGPKTKIETEIRLNPFYYEIY